MIYLFLLGFIIGVLSVGLAGWWFIERAGRCRICGEAEATVNGLCVMCANGKAACEEHRAAKR